MIEFIRSIKAQKDDHKINLMCQPYIIGMYVAGKDTNVDSYLQLTYDHKDYIEWSETFIKGLKKDGYKVEVEKSNLSNFFKESDYKQYIEPIFKSKKKHLKQ